MKTRFQRGTGSYKCEVCGRQTRDTGDNGQSRLCPQCWDLAGYENQLSDYGIEDFPVLTVRNLIDDLETKGADAKAVAEWKATFARVLNPSEPEGMDDGTQNPENGVAPETAEPVRVPSLTKSLLEGERSMKVTEYRQMCERAVIESTRAANRSKTEVRISTHDAINLQRLVVDMVALASVIESLDRAIAGCE